MAIAPYFSAATAADPAQVATTLTLSSDQIVDQMLANIRGDIKSQMTANAALAAKYKLKLKAYESGAGDSSSYFPADKIDAMTALFVSAHNNPRMRDVYSEYYGQWVGAGGDTMNSVRRCRRLVEMGFWGALQYVTQDPATAAQVPGASLLHRGEPDALSASRHRRRVPQSASQVLKRRSNGSRNRPTFACGTSPT